MQILNLDKIAKQPTRELTIDGVTHPILPISVEGFVEINTAVKKMVNAEPLEQLEMIVASVLRQVPTLTRERLIKYDLETANKVAAFVRGEDVDGQEQQAAVEAVEAEAGK